MVVYFTLITLLSFPRLFSGHVSDVDCLTFHPNCNYVASGSSDRSIRMWDCVTGSCVRLMTGHKAAVSCMAFSLDGRFLVRSHTGFLFL